MTIYEALLAVQKEIEPISKSETNPFFKSKYFDINALLGALKPVLNKHGLVITQGLGNVRNYSTIEASDQPALITTIRTDKEKEEYIIPLPDISDPQKFGSAVTYYRRYALQSLFALESCDDDANLAIQQKATSNTQVPKYTGAIKVIEKELGKLETTKPPVKSIHDEDSVPFN